MEEKDIRLVVELCKFVDAWCGEAIIRFIKGETTDCMYFDKVKPYYDTIGYEKTNTLLVTIYDCKQALKGCDNGR